MHQFFHPNAVAQYQPLQQRETVKFLVKLLEKPDTFLHQVRQYVYCRLFMRAERTQS